MTPAAPAARWCIDHAFVFVAPGAPEASALESLGLRESFRRHHPGQGTANLCFCFDNAYLELLWLEDAAEADSCALNRSAWAARAAWRDGGASPFGLALRSDDPEAILPVPAWNYAAPFLPAGQVIPVALASDDPRQPLLFRSPGGARPCTGRDYWTCSQSGNGIVAR